MMPKLCKISFSLALLLMLFVACSKDQTRYIVDLCVVKEHGDQSLYLLSDAGYKLYPSSSLDTTFKNDKRYRVTYVELEGNTTFKNEKVVEIKSILSVSINDVVSGNVFTGALNDPLWLACNPWCGGKFLNIEFSYGKAEDSKIMHSIQLVQDSVVQEKVYMTFGHNANGDLSTKNVTALTSFPLDSISKIRNADSLIIKVLEGKKYRIYRIAVSFNEND